MDTSVLSVGIDIGTSTTSMVASRLYIENTSSSFSAPRIAITRKEVVYRGEIYETPLVDDQHIDAPAIREILENEYRKAGIQPKDVGTGAVIITGESSRKENAELATKELSAFAGDFVVATAGPRLESIIAGKGSGAALYSKINSTTVANLDIGGGTTNIGVFECGEPIGQSCWDIGGRLVRIKNGRIAKISEAVYVVAEDLGMDLHVGQQASVDLLTKITDRMAEVLAEAVGLVPPTDLCSKILTKDCEPLSFKKKIPVLSFSGGVADALKSLSTDYFRYGDIGPLLAKSVENSVLNTATAVIPAEETIRATVIGAGSHTTTVSGSTIFYTNSQVFPQKNIPVFLPKESTERESLKGNHKGLYEEAQWFLEESDTDNLLFAFKRLETPGYRDLCTLADAIVEASRVLPAESPLLILVENDFGKSLGQAVNRRLKGTRSIVSIDSLEVQPGDYMDIGSPLLDGAAVAVVIKTLIFG